MSVSPPPRLCAGPGDGRLLRPVRRKYDEWYRGTGKFASRNRPGWNGELDNLVGATTRLTLPGERVHIGGISDYSPE